MGIPSEVTSVSCPIWAGRSAEWPGLRDGEHPREALGRVPVADDGQAAVALGLGDRLTAESDRAQRGHVRFEGDGGQFRAGAGDLDRVTGNRQPEPVTVNAQRERGVRSRRGGIEYGLEGEEQRVDAQIGRGRYGLPASPASQVEEDRPERLTAAGELVDRDAGGRVEHVPAHDARVLEVAQPL